MISNLEEVNRLLQYFDQYALDSTHQDDLLKQLSKSPVVTQSSLDHKATVDFCVSAGFMERSGGKLFLTSSGRDLMALAKTNKPYYLIDFNQKECDYINRRVFLDPNFDSPIREVLREYFERDDFRKSWRYNYREGEPLPRDFMGYVNLLKQSGLLLEHSGLYEIDPRYSPQVSVLVSERPLVSQEELEGIKERQMKTGQAAEKIVVNQERKELRQIGCEEEARLVTRISTWDTAAGYDIKSFAGPSKTKRHNKFIEVKGSTGEVLRFVWSANEIEKARILGDRYWLYFVGEIDGGRSTKLRKFQDPFRVILNSSKFDKKNTGFVITETRRGRS